MYAVIGSGFGLYGYVPALIARGEHVVLPQAYESKIAARAELRRYLASIEWVGSVEEALAKADAAVIAVPPKQQLQLVEASATWPRLKRLVLEKPLAPTPSLAAGLLAHVDRAGIRYRVGYTLLNTRWSESLDWPRMTAPGNVEIEWSFMAHHFAKGLGNWKRFHADGGGVLRFFGVHLIALLAREGYDTVRSSRLHGEDEREPATWEAVFAGTGLPDCRVRVDSRADSPRFRIAYASADKVRAIVELADPFDEESPKEGNDRRVTVIERLLASLDADDAPFQTLYERTNALWALVESA